MALTQFEKKISINKMLKLTKKIDEIIKEMKARELNLTSSHSKAA